MRYFFVHFSCSKQNFVADLLQILSVCITCWLALSAYTFFFLISQFNFVFTSVRIWWKDHSWQYYCCSSRHAIHWSYNIWGSISVKVWMLSDAASGKLTVHVECIHFRNWNLLCFLKLLEHITFVDTPGVLSGEKQRTQRSYDFTGVTSWFAAKCDLILLLFDPHKLDISDEFKRVISSLRGHDDKIRVVLNKADQVDTQQVQFFLAINLYGLLCLCFICLSTKV